MYKKMQYKKSIFCCCCRTHTCIYFFYLRTKRFL